jgi:hypothetical protein
MTNENNHPRGEKSPNLVTSVVSKEEVPGFQNISI